MLRKNVLLIILLLLTAKLFAYDFTVCGQIKYESTSNLIKNYLVKIVNLDNPTDTFQIFTNDNGFYSKRFKFHEDECSNFEIITYGYKKNLWIKYSNIVESHAGTSTINFEIELDINYPINNLKIEGYIKNIDNNKPFKNFPVNIYPNIKISDKITVYTSNNGLYTYTFNFHPLYNTKVLIELKGNCENEWIKYTDSVYNFDGNFKGNFSICHNQFWFLKEFIIQGHVYDSTYMEPVENHVVYIISLDSLNNNSKVVTNKLGFYADTFIISILDTTDNLFDIKTYSYCERDMVFQNTLIDGYEGVYIKDFYICKEETTNECNSSFFSYLDNQKFIAYFFATSEANDIKSITWDFGDGCTGENADCTHTYEKAGAYLVEMILETESGCISIVTKTIIIGDGFSISGQITASNYSIPNGNILAFRKNDDLTLEYFAYTEILDGEYTFDKIIRGDYLLYAIPDFSMYSNYFPKYIPTYYSKTIDWKKTSCLFLNNKKTSINIDLVKYEEIYYGEGKIHGNFSNPKNNYLKQDQVVILLFNENNEAIDFNIIDENNNFEFDKLPYGNYTVRVQIAGINSEDCFITLDENKPVSPEINFVINGSEISFYYIEIDDIPISDINLEVFPNPFIDNLNISIEGEIESHADIILFNILGNKIFEKRISRNDSKNTCTDLSYLPTGIYLLEAHIDNKIFLTQKLIKK